VDIPISVIEVPNLSPFSFGQLVYFLEMTCGITGLLMGVNPFDQPGVEAYKKEMMAELARK
jgi:glucose-6-phosphate isomerase